MRTLVVSNNILDGISTHVRGVMRSKVDAHGPAVADFTELDKRLAQAQPDMVVVVLSPETERGLEVMRKLRRDATGVIVAVGPTQESKLILRALQEGADHYVDEADLETSLDAVLTRLQQKDDGGTPSARLVAILGASGGSGASTIAVNLATVLARDNQRSILLDLKPGRGDLAALLDLKPNFHLADLCVNVARLDAAMFEKMLVTHSTGVRLLAAPQVFGDTRMVSPQGVSLAITLARKLSPHVVVDLEDCFHEEQVLTLRQASAVLVVSRLDFTSMRNARRILDYLTSEAEVARQRIHLVINRFGQPNELPMAEAEAALGGSISHRIPDDPRTINEANNSGIPAVVKAPGAPVSAALTELARVVLDRRRNGSSQETVPVKKKWLPSLSKMFAR